MQVVYFIMLSPHFTGKSASMNWCNFLSQIWGRYVPPSAELKAKLPTPNFINSTN